MHTAPFTVLAVLCSLAAQPSSAPDSVPVPGDLQKTASVMRLFQVQSSPFIAFELAAKESDVPEVPPGVSEALELGRHEAYSVFLPYHQRLTDSLIGALMETPSFDDFYSTAQLCQNRVNPEMFIYALSEAILNRNDTQDVPLPSLATVSPYKFFSEDTLDQLRKAQRLQKRSTSCAVELPWEHSDSDPDRERRLAYFREDIGVNMHHWEWHLVYPGQGSMEIVDRDRRGELFYYLHEQILARYNAERFSCGLGRVVSIQSFHEPIAEGYDPQLSNEVTDYDWAARADNTNFSDINIPEYNLYTSMEQLDQWHDNIVAAIDSGSVVDEQGQNVTLDIDLLMNVVESSILSVNQARYGSLHNSGHTTISVLHDPNGESNLTFGVMADTAVSMRDIAFYRWHGYIDEMLQRHKRLLPSYTVQQLAFVDVEVADVQVQTDGGPEGALFTFWQRSEIDLSFGVDFSSTGPAVACFTHLQHEPFSYRIGVRNAGQSRLGTVRIFMAPCADESGQWFAFEEQRLLFFELDKFTANLQSGYNEIQRASTQSSVTVPFERTFRNLNPDGLTDDDLADFDYCGCGWPQHLLVPKGRLEGMAFHLFVMVSDFEQDKVEQSPKQGCSDAASYCGLRGKSYPDRQPMGYPFDRKPRHGVSTLPQFLTPNMAVHSVTIFFKDVVVSTGDSL